jgi:hypothetical protein
MKPEDHKSPGFLIFCPYHLEVQFGAVEKVHFNRKVRKEGAKYTKSKL